MKELLIGCGNDRRKRLHLDDPPTWDELVTIDHDPNCGADVVHDLEELPWPFEDNEFDGVHAYEVLEHLGRQGDYKSFFAHFTEIYRVLKHGGHLFATVPAWNDIWAWGDPSHTRIISRASLVFLDSKQYHDQVDGHGTRSPMTDFRWLWKGDFEPIAANDMPGHLWFALRAHKPVRYSNGTT